MATMRTSARAFAVDLMRTAATAILHSQLEYESGCTLV